MQHNAKKKWEENALFALPVLIFYKAHRETEEIQYIENMTPQIA